MPNSYSVLRYVGMVLGLLLTGQIVYRIRKWPTNSAHATRHSHANPPNPSGAMQTQRSPPTRLLASPASSPSIPSLFPLK
eukprot:gene5888-5791_t